VTEQVPSKELVWESDDTDALKQFATSLASAGEARLFSRAANEIERLQSSWDEVAAQRNEAQREVVELQDKLRASHEPPADEAIDYAIRLIQERELSMDDSEGLVVMLTELKQRRAAQPPPAELRVFVCSEEFGCNLVPGEYYRRQDVDVLLAARTAPPSGPSRAERMEEALQIERLRLALRRIRGLVEAPSNDRDRVIHSLTVVALLPTLR
jgi:hypothetical protein